MERWIRLQGVSVLMSVNLREWQYKDTVDVIGDQAGRLSRRVGRALV